MGMHNPIVPLLRYLDLLRITEDAEMQPETESMDAVLHTVYFLSYHLIRKQTDIYIYIYRRTVSSELFIVTFRSRLGLVMKRK